MSEFTPKDFDTLDCGGNAFEAMERANAKLPEIKAQWLKELVEGADYIVGFMVGDGFFPCPQNATHMARLICIEKMMIEE